MGLRVKFNLVLTAVFLAGFVITAWVSYQLLNRSAREQVIDDAGIMMAAALAVRGYTVDQIRPLIDVGSHEEFVKQTVPAFAATQTFEALRATYPDFAYREATINPTNPRNRATDWESDIIERFSADASLDQVIGERNSGDNRSLYLARPIKITNPDCLECHGTVDKAPASLLRTYGNANGFGWQLGDVVGAQIVSVPMSVAVRNAFRLFLVFMTSLLAVYAALFVVLNVMLGAIVIRPVSEIARVADQISLGQMDVAEFETTGSDEIAQLKGAFNRMRRSLERAIRLIDE
jgi:protein-histidine pros-kinase